MKEINFFEKKLKIINIYIILFFFLIFGVVYVSLKIFYMKT